MPPKNFYEILGVSRNASQEEIKTAYRRIAIQYHPDKNPDDPHAEEIFKKATEAYSTLSDSHSRSRYNLHTSRRSYQQTETGKGFIDDVFSQIFSNIKKARQKKGSDIDKELSIPFETAAQGGIQTVHISREEFCSHCNGTGAQPGSTASICHACGGNGVLSMQKGLFNVQRICGYCNGSGRISQHKCQHCAASGKTRRTVEVNVKIPAGADTGTVIRYRGEGNVGSRGKPNGDLRISLRLKEHSLFKREGNNILYEHTISLPQAALGTEIVVPTLEGETSMKIPPGTQSKQVFRLKHKGMQDLHSNQKGDQLVTISVRTPTKLSQRQRELLKEFAQLEGEDVFYEEHGIINKVRNLFGN